MTIRVWIRRLTTPVVLGAWLVSTGTSDEWTAVRFAANRSGYVYSRLVRSPIGYRAFFTRENGRWMLAMFVAGD
jgi:hypothetical protein